ncbi:MAG: nuclear transport factor 2 family protein [Ignavibacteriaceae bacterium]|nr:nuclear transport factor 2 family protein [Ignavibacteriaceae bacterium]
MKTLSLLFIVVFLVSGCKSEKLTTDEINAEKDKVKTRIESFLLSYANKDMNKIIAMLSSSEEFHFLGSDVSEINKNKSDFQNQLDQDWKLFESVHFGEIRNLSIRISECGDLAVAVFDAPMTVTVKGNQSKFFFRISNTFVKEKGLWQLVQGLGSIPSVGESSVELIQKLK